MNSTEIKAILASLGRNTANKALGQHFLLDQATLDAVVDSAKVTPEDIVVEIGPGLGVLTKALLERGARVYAVERDRDFVRFLQDRFAEEIKAGTLILLSGDAADGEWASLLGNKSWKLVANLPYAISSLVFRFALTATNPPRAISVLIQKEVADRLTAQEGRYSLLFLLAALTCEEMDLVQYVPAEAFWPPPKVESAVISMRPRSAEARDALVGGDLEKVMAVARAGFAHPRKKVRSNLLTGLGLSPEQVDALFASIGIPELARAETLSPKQWIRLTEEIQVQKSSFKKERG